MTGVSESVAGVGGCGAEEAGDDAETRDRVKVGLLHPDTDSICFFSVGPETCLKGTKPTPNRLNRSGSVKTGQLTALWPGFCTGSTSVDLRTAPLVRWSSWATWEAPS
eukprot:3441910-Amphidinium_carterae.3